MASFALAFAQSLDAHLACGIMASPAAAPTPQPKKGGCGGFFSRKNKEKKTKEKTDDEWHKSPHDYFGGEGEVRHVLFLVHGAGHATKTWDMLEDADKLTLTLYEVAGQLSALEGKVRGLVFGVCVFVCVCLCGWVSE